MEEYSNERLIYKNDINKFYEWYNQYISSFLEQENLQIDILRKNEHTLRVVNNALEIAQSLKLNEDKLRLAEIIALFHDIGRFEQYSKLNTMFDNIKDHGDMAIIVLKRSKILEEFSVKEKDIILKAIKYHNKREIPMNEDEETIVFSKLIRDADKLDNYNLHVKCFEEKSEQHISILKVLPDIREYSSTIVDYIFNNKCSKQSDLKTYNDLKLSYIAWIFDINYEYSLKKIIDEKYIDRIINTLYDVKEKEKIYLHVCDYINSRRN